MQNSEKFFSFLQGQWRLERSINAHGIMKGIASFSPFFENDPLSLFYREEGENTLQNGACFSFFKEYCYQLCDSFIDVYFIGNNKRKNLFHRLTFLEHKLTNIAVGEHICNKDIYRATYQFWGLDQFRLDYHVQGPKKILSFKVFFSDSVKSQTCDLN